MKPIKDEQSYTESLQRIEELWGAEPDTPEGDELDILLVLVEAYEEKHYPIPPSDPVQAILFRMATHGCFHSGNRLFLKISRRAAEGTKFF